MKIPITKLTIGDEEAVAVANVLKSGWLIQGAKVAEFEDLLKKYTGAKYAVACSSCTTALHMSLLALRVQAGQEVLVPAFTFVATPNAVEYTGAKPVFVDIDLKTFNSDTEEVLQALREHVYSLKNITAVIPVHLFGMCSDMLDVVAIALAHGLHVVEDAACALGSLYKGHHSGTLGNTGCFSFHPRKSLTTGEGGVVITSDEGLYRRIRALRDFGFETTNLERHKTGADTMPEVRVLGYNYRMTDIQAAIGIEQFKKFDWTVLERQKRARVYDEQLKGIQWLQTPTVAPNRNHTYQSYVTLVWDWDLGTPNADNVQKMAKIRDGLVAHLANCGIATRQGTQAVHALEYYRKKYRIKEFDYPNAYAAARLSVSLPLFPQMTEAEQEYVINRIWEFHS